VLLARRRWYRARSEHENAMRIHHSDVESAMVARQAWHALVETQTSADTG
jgi:hypothetical protein